MTTQDELAEIIDSHILNNDYYYDFIRRHWNNKRKEKDREIKQLKENLKFMADVIASGDCE